MIPQLKLEDKTRRRVVFRYIYLNYISSGLLGVLPGDVVYIPLPIYHSSGGKHSLNNPPPPPTQTYAMSCHDRSRQVQQSINMDKKKTVAGTGETNANVNSVYNDYVYNDIPVIAIEFHGPGNDATI